MDLFEKIKIDFLLFIELINYFNINKYDNYIDNLLELLTQSEIDEINVDELNKFKKKYLSLFEKFTCEDSNENVQKGLLIIKIYLYLCLDYDKFENYYNKIILNEKKKEFINLIISKNKTIERLFITKKIIVDYEKDQNMEILTNMLKQCKYFENYIYLLSFSEKLLNNINFKNIDSLIQSENDNIQEIRKNYDKIINNIPFNEQNNFRKKLDNYNTIFENSKKIEKIILSSNEESIKSINSCIKQDFDNLYFSNIQICEYIKK